MHYMIKLEQLLIGYKSRQHTHHILSKALNFSASPGEMVVVVGPNGVGKSTLLRTLARQQNALGGSIYINKKRWDEFPHKVFARICSFVPTGQPPVRQLSVFEVVAMARYPYTHWGGHLQREDMEKIYRALEGVNLVSLKDRLLGELSDGERQRALIARALAQDTPLVILDEPTAFLDIPNRFEVLQLMRKISGEQHKLFIFSSHDLAFILEIADKIWLLYPQRAYEGTPEELLRDEVFNPLFKNTGIHYDIHKGLHIPPRQCHTAVNLTGDTDELPWVRKALLRTGYTIAKSNISRGNILIRAEKKQYHVLIKNQREEIFQSIYSLLLYLKDTQTESGHD